MRIGLGFDAHKFIKDGSGDNHIMIGGVEVKCKYKLEAHSDGDVLLHAITDAVLGALALGDIGEHFPPSDEKWRNCNSAYFLKYVVNLIAENQYKIANIDSVVIAEHPRLLDYKQMMRERISSIINIDVGIVSVKATTTEKMGFTGREEGIAAQAVILLIPS